MPSSFGPPADEPAYAEGGRVPPEAADEPLALEGLEVSSPARASASPQPAAAQEFVPSSFGPPASSPPPRPSAPARPAGPPRPQPAPAAPAAASAAAADPFAPPDEREEQALDLAVQPRARRTGPPGTTHTADPGTDGALAQPRARRAATPRSAGLGAGAIVGAIFVTAVAVAAGYFPARLYAQHVDTTKVAQLQKEFVMLATNPWKGEATRRTKEQVRHELDEIRGHSTLLMMGIWAACSGLLAALAYVLF
jgi:hypothetical protein